MSTQVQRRKGTTAQHASFTGASAELTVDTTKNTVVVHDGDTAGGIPLAKETGSALSVTSLVSSGAAIIEATDTAAALRITQLGTGNSLLVEDSSNPDSSPFVIDTAGRVAIGHIATVAGTGPSSSTRPSLQVHGMTNSTSGAGVYNWSSTAALTSAVTFNRSLSNVVGTFGGAVTSSTSLGAISFSGDDGTSFYESVRILAQADGSATTGSTPGRLLFYTTPSGTTTPVERLRIGNSGDITIASGVANGVTYFNASKVLTSGTALTFDGSKLAVGQASVTAGSVVQVNGALLASGVVTTLDTTNLGVQIGGGGTVAASGASTVAGIYADVNGFGGASDLIIRPRSDGTPGALRVYTGTGGGLERYKVQADGVNVWTIGSEQMRLTSTGLGIGTSSPAEKLTVVGNIRLNGNRAVIFQQDSGVAVGALSFRNSSGVQKAAIASYYNIADEGAIEFVGPTNSTNMMLSSSGNLGLGVTPSAWETVSAIQLKARSSLFGFSNDTHVGYNLYYTSIGYKYIATDNASDYQQTGGQHRWYNAPSGTAGNAISFTQAMTLDASGNLLVGTTNNGGTNAKLELDYAGSFGAALVNTNNTSGTEFLKFYNSTFGVCGLINRVGTTNAVVYNTTSDYRLKTVIGPVANAGQRIDALQPVEYTWNASGDLTRGFLAHQFQEVYAGSVSGVKDAVDAEGKPVYQSMQASSSEVIADLIAEIQSLRARVASLESK